MFSGLFLDWQCPVEITGDEKAVMQYVNYDELIQKYGVELQGWTFEKLVNPSLLSTGGYHFYDKSQAFACSTSCIMLSGLMKCAVS
jgi:hypothetical protein